MRKTGDTDSTNLDVLAQAYFQNGDRAHAIEAEEKAIGLLAPSQGTRPDAPMRGRLESQLAKFKAGEDPSRTRR